MGNISYAKAFILDTFYKKIYSEYNPINVSRINIQIKLQLENLNNSIKDIVENQNSKNKLNESLSLIKTIISQVNIKKYLDEFISNIDIKEINMDSHKNILVIGKTGVGKSTLINSFLNINEAKTGIGFTITMDFKAYISKPDCKIRLTDSKGFEGNYQNEIEIIKNMSTKVQ